MTEHPNYKYRPRRRKHNKQRTTPGPPPAGARVAASVPSPSGGSGSLPPNVSPRYGGYMPNASLSPNVQQGGYASTMEYPSPGGSVDYSAEKRFSPDNYKFSSQFGYVSYQSYPQKSPYSVQSPEISPTQSPEPKGSKPPASPVDSKEGLPERNASLPTPQLSPLEHEKDQYQQYEDKRITNIPVSSHMTSPNVSPAQQSYNARVQNFRQQNNNYTNTQPITSVPMANGMYVMCANKSSVEQGHIVTGTFYPPVATSQDQQLLGSAHNNINTVTVSTPNNLQYYGNIHPYYSKEYTYETHDPNKDSFLGYQHIKGLDKDYFQPYKPMDEYAEYIPQDNHMVQTYVPGTEERSDVDSDVDTREFDKYLKFANNDSNVIDSNHNYHRNELPNSNLTYNIQAQHPSVILPNSNIKPEPFIGHCPEVYDLATNGVQKNEDDFSEILAGVRKTCFSTT